MDTWESLSSEQDEILVELRRILKAGFPLTDQKAGTVLTEQRVVIANAQHPDQRASRIAALARVLYQQLDGLGRGDRGQAARALFGVARGTRGMTLTNRRIEAALILERHEDHVRKHIEPQLLVEMAFAIHQENLRYTPPSSLGRPEIAAHEDTPVLTDQSFTEKEELVCRIWSAVYGYRGELIAVQRLIDDARREEREPDPDLSEHLAAAKWELARMLTVVHDYVDKYGETIMHGDTPFNVEGLVKLAGWSGGLRGDEADALRLRLAVDPGSFSLP